MQIPFFSQITRAIKITCNTIIVKITLQLAAVLPQKVGFITFASTSSVMEGSAVLYVVTGGF